MEYQIFRPKNEGPRHRSVELEDVQNLHPAPVVATELAPASPELIDHLWQREAAMSSLRGIYATMQPGMHRRQESFLEVARDEIGSRWRRVRSAMGQFAGRLAAMVPEREQPEYVGLDDFGFAYDMPLEEVMATLPEAPVSPAVGPIERAPAPHEEWITPLQATHYFTSDELAAMRRAVTATHQKPAGTIYTGGEYAGSDA